MEAQEIFDTVVAHLYRQKVVSVMVYEDSKIGTICAYRGENGTKCAAGVLIPDEYYKPEMENETIFNLTYSFKVPDFLKTNLQLIRELQRLHDKHFVRREILFNNDDLEDLMEITGRYGLTFDRSKYE